MAPCAVAWLRTRPVSYTATYSRANKRMVFEGFRRSFDELLSRSTRPEDRRIVASRMKETLVQARAGLNDLRDALAKARERLAAETHELETVRRRRQLAEGIGDKETVGIATKYEEMHAQRVDAIQKKVSAEEAELLLAEREVESMTVELKAVMAGTAPGGGAPAIDPGGVGDLGGTGSEGNAALRDEIDSLGRQRAREDREADAARRLDELKRKMGK